jgi:hypothetical protein
MKHSRRDSRFVLFSYSSQAYINSVSYGFRAQSRALRPDKATGTPALGNATLVVASNGQATLQDAQTIS